MEWETPFELPPEAGQRRIKTGCTCVWKRHDRLGSPFRERSWARMAPYIGRQRSQLAVTSGSGHKRRAVYRAGACGIRDLVGRSKLEIKLPTCRFAVANSWELESAGRDEKRRPVALPDPSRLRAKKRAAINAPGGSSLLATRTPFNPLSSQFAWESCHARLSPITLYALIVVRKKSSGAAALLLGLGTLPGVNK
jgi:hypothetical protein